MDGTTLLTFRDGSSGEKSGNGHYYGDDGTSGQVWLKPVNDAVATLEL